MLPVFIGTTLAASFALLTASIYGARALAQEPWIMLVLWGLVTGSCLMAVAARDLDVLPRGGRDD